MQTLRPLSRREREIMDIIYRAGSVTAGEVQERLTDPPSYSAVRATLRILENKGFLRHESDGARYVYQPILDRKRARRGAITHVVETFFEGSTASAVLALLEQPGKISQAEFERMTALIERARKEGR